MSARKPRADRRGARETLFVAALDDFGAALLDFDNTDHSDATILVLVDQLIRQKDGSEARRASMVIEQTLEGVTRKALLIA